MAYKLAALYTLQLHPQWTCLFDLSGADPLVVRHIGMSGRASRARRAGCQMWLIMFDIVDLSAELDGIGFNYGGGETLSSKVTGFLPSRIASSHKYGGPWETMCSRLQVVVI